MRPASLLLALGLLGTAAPERLVPAALPLTVFVASGGPRDLLTAMAGAAAAVNVVLGSGLRVAVQAGSAGAVRDGRLTASFGPLDPSLHAFTWLWAEEGRIVEADIVFRQDDCWANLPDGTPSPGCPLDLRTVALHELLHLAGFLHAEFGVDKPSVMETVFPAARHTLEPKDVASLELFYPPVLALAPETLPPLSLAFGEEGEVLAARLYLVGWPAALTGATVTAGDGPPLAQVRLVHEFPGGSTTLGSSTDPLGPWAFSFAAIIPGGNDRLAVHARRDPAPAPAALPVAAGAFLLLAGGRRRRLLALVLVLAACGGASAPRAAAWRFSVAPGGLTSTTGAAAIVGDAWIGPPIAAP